MTEEQKQLEEFLQVEEIISNLEQEVIDIKREIQKEEELIETLKKIKDSNK